MKIGIDIDDTLTKTSEEVIKYKKIAYPDLNPYELLPQNLFIDFIQKYRESIYLNCETKENASKSLKVLKDLGYEINIITVRDNTELSRNSTLANFKKNNIIYDNIYFGIEDKGSLVEKLDIDIFIDDRYEKCKQVKGKTKVIKFKRKDEEQDKFVEFDNWKDIIKYIKEDIWKES